MAQERVIPVVAGGLADLFDLPDGESSAGDGIVRNARPGSSKKEIAARVGTQDGQVFGHAPETAPAGSRMPRHAGRCRNRIRGNGQRGRSIV
ncbi:MAG: hypothetical protein ACP5C4_08175 [Methanomicrobiales archaeon]